MAAKKTLMLAGDYAEDCGTMVSFQALQMMDRQVHMVCPDKRAGQSARTTIYDSKSNWTYSEKLSHNFILNAGFVQARAEDCDALLIPGGHTPEYLRLGEQVLALVCAFGAARRPVVAACHDTQLLAAAGVLQGRMCSAHLACTPETWLAGGEYVDIPLDQAHVDSRLVTAPAQPVHPAWLTRFLGAPGTRISH